MVTNPCRKCNDSYVYKNRHYPSCVKDTCAKCRKRIEHEKYLKSNRKYEVGDYISTFDELLKQEWIMFFGKPKHISVILNMQAKTVLNFVNNKQFRYAIKKECESK